MRIKWAAGLLLCAGLASAQGKGTARWVGSWACSQQIPESNNVLAAADLNDATVRQVVHLSVGGARLRVHLSNAFGTQPLLITAAHVARARAADSGEVDGATDRALSFGGQAQVTIPAGAEYVSDPLVFAAAPLSNLTVSIHLANAPAQQTGHPGSRATSYVAHGDQTGVPVLSGAKTFEHWTMLSGVDVEAGAYAVVALGDSITDGHGATTNANNRWPDVLAERLQKSHVGVLNQGIGGNHLLTDGLGPNVLARFDRDVLAQPGVRAVIVLEGINDLGALAREGEVAQERHAALVRVMEGAYEQIVLRAHAQGIRVIGGTITPDMGSDYYHPNAANEADRVAVNVWIRVPGHFDAVIDFDRMVADPQHLSQLLPAYDSGDHLHPSVAGYKVMGQGIALGVLGK
jgi:lysophospholipase L1-like esterase